MGQVLLGFPWLFETYFLAFARPTLIITLHGILLLNDFTAKGSINSKERKELSSLFENSPTSSFKICVPANTSRSMLGINDKIMKSWSQLTLLDAQKAFQYVMCHNASHERTKDSYRKNRDTFILVSTEELKNINPDLENIFRCLETSQKIVSFDGRFSSESEVLQTLRLFLDMEAEVRGVIVASSHTNFIYRMLNTAATHSVFKWRQLLHATEWLALIIDQPNWTSTLLPDPTLPDFVTVISLYSTNNGTSLDIIQKSRVEPLQKKLHVPLYSFSQGNLRNTFYWQPKTNRSQLSNALFLSQHLRLNAVAHLALKKSVMADMLVPAVMVQSEADRVTSVASEENGTSSSGLAVLNLLSKSLGFKAQTFPVQDGGFYSVFKSNGDVLGAVGYLSRREAGLCPMGMIRTERRQEFVEYVYPPIRGVHLYIMYRVHVDEGSLSDALLEIAQTKRSPLFLIGPCVAIVTGLIVYLMNGVVFTRDRICGRTNLRRLYNFPLLWVFQTSGNFRHHSARILRASWGLFCVIMFATCGALLTSRAAVPQESPCIRNLDDLLDHPEFEIGISRGVSYFITAMRDAKPGTILARLWQVLREQNKTDPLTFSTDRKYHVTRALKGGYAYIGDIPIQLLSSLVQGDYKTMRFATIQKETVYVTIPKYTFYYDDLVRALRAANEYGLLETIHQDQAYANKLASRGARADTKAKVTLFQLHFLGYIMAYGIGLAFVSLAVEILAPVRTVLRRRFYR